MLYAVNARTAANKSENEQAKQHFHALSSACFWRDLPSSGNRIIYSSSLNMSQHGTCKIHPYVPSECWTSITGCFSPKLLARVGDHFRTTAFWISWGLWPVDSTSAKASGTCQHGRSSKAHVSWTLECSKNPQWLFLGCSHEFPWMFFLLTSRNKLYGCVLVFLLTS